MTMQTDARGRPTKAGEVKKAPRLQVVKLEGRIAPKLSANHSETLVRDRA